MEKQTTKLSIRIPSFQEQTISSEKAMYYEVETTYMDQTWSAQRRYNDFHELYTYVKELMKEEFDFPAKTFFSVSSTKALEQRRVKLEGFLEALCSSTAYTSNKRFLDFIGAADHCRSLYQRVFRIEGKFTHEKMGFRDIQFLENHSMMFSFNSEVEISSKKIFGSNNGYSALCEGWQILRDDSGRFEFKRFFVKALNIKGRVMDTSDSMGALILGLDNGSIFYQKFDFEKITLQINKPKEGDQDEEQKEYDDLEEEEYLKLHSGIVKGVRFYNKQKLILSVSEDLMLVTYSPELKMQISSNNLFFIHFFL